MSHGVPQRIRPLRTLVEVRREDRQLLALLIKLGQECVYRVPIYYKDSNQGVREVVTHYLPKIKTCMSALVAQAKITKSGAKKKVARPKTYDNKRTI